MKRLIEILKNPLFLTGLILRVGLLFFPSQGVMSDLFIPFMDFAVQNPMENPWNNMPAEHFPYGIVLFVLIFIPKFIVFLLFGEASLGTHLLSFFAMKLPLLLIDLAMVKLLIQITGNRTNHVLLFYWLNPITIYISFIHGQLDLVPMFLSITGIFFAGQKNAKWSGLFTSLAVLSKFHTVIVAPLVLAYFWNDEFTKHSIPKIRQWLGVFLATLCVGLLPLYFSNKLQYNSVGSPEAFRIFSLNFNFNDQITIYFGVMIVIFILGRLMLSTKMSAEGLFFGSSLLFGSLLVVTHSMPGWYLWILPFLAVFFAIYNFVPRILMGLLIVFYFLCMPKWIELPQPLNSLFYGISFSILQLVVLTILVFIYIMALNKQAPFQRRLRPLTIGIAGNSGTGKNLISFSLQNLFGQKTTRIIEGDDYHKWERGNVKWEEYTHLHPRANHLSDLKGHINSLIHGKLIFQRHYDHSSGRFTEPKALQATKTLIVQGLHTLYLKSLRSDFDLKIYISPHESIRTAWKIKRDCGERGHSLEKVLQSIKSREKDTQLYVQPQKEVADMVIEYIPVAELNPLEVLNLKVIPFKLKLVLWNDTSVEELIDALSGIKSMTVELVDEADINQIGIILHGDITKEEVITIANTVIPNQRSITRSRLEPAWDAGYVGMIQLFIIKLLSERV